MNTLGTRVYELRIRRDLTQLQLSRLVKTSQVYISRLERGELANPTLRVLTKVAGALGTTVSQLVR